MRFRNPEARMGRAVTGGTAALASLALLASGCGSSQENNSDNPVRLKETGTLVFDDLGGGSSVIRVFSGPRSEEANGTYFDGDKVKAICKTEGSERESDPSVGEEPRQSDEWIKIEGTPGEQQYATAVYIEQPEQLLSQLQDC